MSIELATLYFSTRWEKVMKAKPGAVLKTKTNPDHLVVTVFHPAMLGPRPKEVDDEMAKKVVNELLIEVARGGYTEMELRKAGDLFEMEIRNPEEGTFYIVTSQDRGATIEGGLRKILHDIKTDQGSLEKAQ